MPRASAWVCHRHVADSSIEVPLPTSVRYQHDASYRIPIDYIAIAVLLGVLFFYVPSDDQHRRSASWQLANAIKQPECASQ